MPEYKGVYFTPDGQWFESRQEAEYHEKIEEVFEYVRECLGDDIPHIHLITQALMVRYAMDDRYGYAALVRPQEEESHE